VIECPICHVQNEDRSLFCAECGQRFGPNAGQKSPSPASYDARSLEVITGLGRAPERPQFKLRSPFLDGAFVDEDEGSQHGGAHGQTPPANAAQQSASMASPKSSPAGHSTGNTTGNTTANTKGLLRSVANVDEPVSGASNSALTNSGTHKRGLHSPLLRFGEDEEEVPPHAGGMFPHRSNSKLNQPAADVIDPAGGKSAKHLRSPLLDTGDFKDEEEESAEIIKGKRLRSPVLGGSQSQVEDDFIARVPESDPNALRSPLLIARVQQPEKPPVSPPPAQPTNQPATASPPPSILPQSLSITPDQAWSENPANSLRDKQRQELEMSDFSSTSPTLSGANSLTVGSQSASPTVDTVASRGESVNFLAQTAESATAPWPSVSEASTRNGVPQPSIARDPAPPPGPPKVLPPLSGSLSGDSSRGYGAQAPTPTSRAGYHLASDTESGAREARREEPYGEALPSKSQRQGSRSRLLPDSDQADHVESVQPRMTVVVGKIMLIPLFFAVAFKVWFLVEMGGDAFKSMPFLCDQVSQLVVIVCLMVFTYVATSELGP
jgi:hypothetical protein